MWGPGIADALAKVAEAGADNVRFCGVDAVWSLEHLLAPGSLTELWTFFPDPWHKNKHHKRRLVTPANAAVAAAGWRPGGVWRLATDWAEYAEQMIEVLDAEPRLKGGRVERWEERPLTRFERKGPREDRDIGLAYTRGLPVRRRRRRVRIHRAWSSPAVTMAALVAAAGFRSSTGALLEPLEEEFGWSRSTTSGAVTPQPDRLRTHRPVRRCPDGALRRPPRGRRGARRWSPSAPASRW